MEFKTALHSAAKRPGMDLLMPVLCILDTSVPRDRQQCLLKATKEARACQSSKPSQTYDDSRLRDPKTALEEAKRRCQMITATPTEKQFLGQLIITFGKYNGKSFKWLVENDVGYVKYILDCHIKESRQPDRKAGINDEWVKDYLLKYVQLFPPVSCHLEINVDRAICDQGRFRSFTFREIRFRLYIVTNETEKPAQKVAPPAATATSSSSGSKGHGSWTDDALLAEALATSERQGDTDPTPPEKEAQPETPQQPETASIPQPPAPPPAPGGQHGRTSVTGAALLPSKAPVTPFSYSSSSRRISDLEGERAWQNHL